MKVHSRYYRLFMYHYALALRRSSLLMVNSSWTKNHVGSILAYSDPLLDLIHSPLTFIGGLFLSLTRVLAPLLHPHAYPRDTKTSEYRPPTVQHTCTISR